MNHILKSNTLTTFQQLAQEFGIGSNEFLKYIQLKFSVLAKINIRAANLEIPPEISDSIDIYSPKKLLSKIYSTK